jgi:hypothetical protein
MPPNKELTAHLRAALRSVPWFDRLDAEGVIAGMLASGDATEYEHVMNLVPTVAKQRADRLAQLIEPYAGVGEQYPNWLAWVSRFADVHNSRPLFDLMLDAIRRGDYNAREGALWLAAFGLDKQQPAWAVELLAAWLSERPGAFDLDEGGRLPALQNSEHNLVDLVPGAAEGAPAQFVELIVPYLRRVVMLTETTPDRRPVLDGHFSYRQPGPGPMPELGAALLHGAVTALRRLVQVDPAAAQPVLDGLAGDPHDAAQWLLYRALTADPERYADWAGDLLLQGEHRFLSGYMSDSYWSARELIEAAGPHLSHERFGRLETAVLAFRPSWEDMKSAGWSSFTLLSALPEARLSQAARRRLGELRRRFNRDQPSAPTGFVGGTIASPVPATAIKHMTDDQWLAAMRKHGSDVIDFAHLKGGVHELGNDVRNETIKNPTRFARLALRLTPDFHPYYADAILDGLGQTEAPVDATLVFNVMRHVAAFAHVQNDKSLSMPLRRQLDSDVPDDIIEIVLGRALHAPDPSEELWAKQAPGGSGQTYYGGDIFNYGINTARGQAALMLGDLLVHDADGHRTQLVAASLGQLAEDPSAAVRSCVAHLLSASLRHASDEAVAAFERLTVADDRLLATRPVIDLVIYIGMAKPDLIEPVVRRMLSSPFESVRETGGLLAAYAGLEFGLVDLFRAARDATDAATRKGAADFCARNLAQTTDATEATAALLQFFTDEDDDVRDAAAQVAAALRNRALRPYSDLLTALIASPAYPDALAQLLITLRAAPDRIDDLFVQCTRRYVQIFATEAGNIATAAAGEAPEIVQLTLRAYAQASTPDIRRAVLDLIDQLLFIDAFGVQEAVNQAER